jgi:hypothetical protein
MSNPLGQKSALKEPRGVHRRAHNTLTLPPPATEWARANHEESTLEQSAAASTTHCLCRSIAFDLAAHWRRRLSQKRIVFYQA